MKSKMMALAAATVISSFAMAGTYYVDDDNYGKGGLDGSTEALAYGTIQEAVDAAPSGSTILVLPGVYDQGGKDHDGFFNRVLVNGKALTIKSTGGRAVTTVKGAKDPDTLADPKKCGNGPNAIRAFKFVNVSSVNTVVVEGFTVTDAAVKEPFDAHQHNYGSAAYVSGTGTRYGCFVDCDFHGNAGSRGLLYGGTYVRCFIHDNFLPDGKGTATWLGSLLNCVVTRNAEGGVVTGGKAVNCTLLDFGKLGGGAGKVGTESSVFVNCLAELAAVNGEALTFDHCVTKFEDSLGKSVATNSITDANRLQLVSPLTDDYRLLPTSQALGFGDASALADFWVPDGVDRYLDFYGNAIPTSGKICVGAVQAAATPKSGSVVFTDGFVTLSDRTNEQHYVSSSYMAAMDYPVQWHVVPQLASGEHLYGFEVDGVTGGWRFPEMDETLWIMPPPAGRDIYCRMRRTQSAIYVDPVNGRDGSTGEEDVRGTADKPFETLQAAADLAKTLADAKTYTYSVVYAAEGVYDKGGRREADVSNRVYTASRVRIKGAGAGRSIIKGHLDTESEESERSVDGRGATACRCACLGAGALQGFTLADGRCGYRDDKGGHTGDCAATRAGGVYGNGSVSILPSCSSFVLDCVITNCIAIRGAPTFLVDVFRSQILDIPYGQARYSYYHSCVFHQTDKTGRTDLDPSLNAEPVIGGSCVLTQCNDFGLPTLGCWSNNRVPSINSISKTGADLVNAYCDGWQGCLADGFSSYASGDYVQADPEFADEASGDYNVHGSSPALDCGVLTDDYWTRYSSDFNGNPITFVNGKPMAGAFHQPLKDRVAVVVSQTSVKGNVEPTGRQVVNVGETLTVTATDTTRHLLGLSVNGELVAGTSWSFAPVPGAVPLGATTVEALYSTNWYVNANTDAAKGVVGSDENTGFTPETAKQTLAGVMAVDLEKGDVIHAAPGVYDQGSMTQKYKGNGGAATTPVRVCVDAGIALVGDEGAGQTVIKGYRNATKWSDVTDGMRCVNLAEGATVKGFTLAGGTTPFGAGENEPYLGGGVIAPVPNNASTLPLVQDCIITNCWACRGGGAFGGAFRNCKFIDNFSNEDGSVSFRSWHENCFMDLNHGRSDTGVCQVRYPFRMINVTMTERNYSDDTGTEKASKFFLYDGATYKCPLINCIILGGFGSGSRCGEMPTTNCIFSSSAEYASDATATWSGCVTKAPADVLLDADGRPTAGSPAIDFGDSTWPLCATDLDGTQRIYNGAVDAGCYEYDWRPDYAAAIGGGVTVETASPGVTLVDGKVRIPNGDVVAGAWPASSGKARYAVPMTAVDGTLTGTLVAPATQAKMALAVTDDSVTQRFRLANTALDFTFGFAGTGYGEIADFDQTVPGLLLFLR